MRIRHNTAMPILALIALSVLTISPAFGHRFNVALVIAQSSSAMDRGLDIRNGFMLATTERDSHPDQESDGHLGGLDVYVTVIDKQEDIAAGIQRLTGQGTADIVAAFGPEKTLTMISNLLDGKNLALLLPGSSPFSNSELPAVAAFGAAYKQEYGGKPTSYAAQGYNAARRIDKAVRAQGGVDDRASLLRVFEETARGFTW